LFNTYNSSATSSFATSSITTSTAIENIKQAGHQLLELS
jgi:hypothetical protein